MMGFLDVRSRVAVVTGVLFLAGLSAGGCSDDSGGPGGGEGGEGGGAASPQKLMILHTNDLHSHLMGRSPEADYSPLIPNDDDTRGGMARLATAIGVARAEASAAGKPVLLLDAGDFMMGTLFEIVATQAASELGFMQRLGYDATTLGNHELDWSPAGLAAILEAARANDIHVPIVASNLEFSASDAGDDDLEALAGAGAIQPKLIKTVGSLKVGFFGLLGADAVQVTPQSAPLTFGSIAGAARRMVSELRDTDQVDLVIALSHSGISSDGTGEDADLARNVEGIDVIVSGHTHETLTEPARVGRTLIVTAGSYGNFLGRLEIEVTPSETPGGEASVSVDGYQLQDIDDSIEGDAAIQDAVDATIDGVDQALAPSGLAYEQLIATTGHDIPLPERVEAPIGNLVTDAYRTISAALEPEPAVIGVEANGQLRASLLQGKSGEIWFADLFQITPIGIGTDGQPGFSLVTFYLNANDIRSGLELGAAGPVLSNDLFLQVSGLKVEFDSTLPLFSRITALTLETPDGDQPIDLSDTTTCYKVVTTSYVAGLLGLVKSNTVGLLSVEAKDRDCATLVDPTERFVDADPGRAGVQQLKNWQALVQFVSGFPDGDDDGVPDVPAFYAMPQGRIVEQ